MRGLTLIEAIIKIGYDSQWGVYAEKIDGKFTPESPARIGQRRFENGDVLDGAEYFANGEWIGDRFADWECADEQECASAVIDYVNGEF